MGVQTDREPNKIFSQSKGNGCSKVNNSTFSLAKGGPRTDKYSYTGQKTSRWHCRRQRTHVSREHLCRKCSVWKEA